MAAREYIRADRKISPARMSRETFAAANVIAREYKKIGSKIEEGEMNAVLTE